MQSKYGKYIEEKAVPRQRINFKLFNTQPYLKECLQKITKLLIVHKEKLTFNINRVWIVKTGSVAFSNFYKTDEHLERKTVGWSPVWACPYFERKDKAESEQVKRNILWKMQIFENILYRITLDLTDNIKEKKEADTILLKIEANFRENQIIRSMYQPGEGWMREEISKNWKNGTPKNPLVPGDVFHFRVAVLQKCFEIYVNDKLYGTFEHLECPKKINYALVTGDFEKITQFHHRMLFPLVFPRCLSTSCTEKLCFQSDVPQKYETGFY